MKGKAGNMSFLLFEPAGKLISVHAWKFSQNEVGHTKTITYDHHARSIKSNIKVSA